MDIRASMPKSPEIVPNTLCLQAFQHKHLKKPMVFQRKIFKFRVRALMLKSYKNHRFLMNSGKSTDFISPRGAPAILLSCAEGTNPLQKIPRGPHARTAARAHDQSDRFLELHLCKRGTCALQKSDQLLWVCTPRQCSSHGRPHATK